VIAWSYYEVFPKLTVNRCHSQMNVDGAEGNIFCGVILIRRVVYDSDVTS
jgi:hypothetical protein